MLLAESFDLSGFLLPIKLTILIIVFWEPSGVSLPVSKVSLPLLAFCFSFLFKKMVSSIDSSSYVFDSALAYKVIWHRWVMFDLQTAC